MAEYISFQPNDYYSTTLYTGDGTAANAITGVGFQPDFVWNKPRDTTGWHRVFDSVRGVLNVVYPNDTYVNEVMPSPGGLNAFDSDGYTMGTNTGSNENTKLFVTWNWKAGTTSGLSGGTITPTAYSFNTTSCSSIIKYTGNGSAGATIPHGLGKKPDLIMVKCMSNTESWMVYHTTLGATKFLKLDQDGGPVTATSRWNDTEPTSTVFSVGTSSDVNTNTETYIAYVFASVKGFSKISTYVGNGNANGPFVYTGFKPAFVLIKYNGTNQWQLRDNKRGFNGAIKTLYPDSYEVETSGDTFDILSNGFKPRNTGTPQNQNGVGYYYAAFAECPIVSSNDVPTVAR